MLKEIEVLEKFDCEITKTLERMLNDENFYLECVHDALTSSYYEQLGTCINKGMIKDAFEVAHLLKGVLLNTGLLPLAKITFDIVEILRNNSLEGTNELYAHLIETLHEIKMALSQN